MTDRLVSYLHDHLAGSHFAIKLLGSLAEQYPHEELGKFATALKAEITLDQRTLQKIADQAGKGHLDLMEAAGWVAEKASQIKLHRDATEGGLGTFEALETLTLGIQGKMALWRALPVIREVDSRIPAEDYDRLLARAQSQFGLAEEQRLKLASVTFEHAAK
jgi:hypothetical protein